MAQKYNLQKAVSKLVSTTILKFVSLTILKLVSTLIKTGLLLLLAVAMVFVNFRVDSLQYFYTDPVNRQYADYLRQGYALDNYTRMDERVVRTRYLETLDAPLDVAAIGSSRILQLSQEIVGEDMSFFNLGASGGGLADMIGNIYRLELTCGLPKNLVLGLDPWLLNPNPDITHRLCDMDLYYEFLDKRLGITPDTEYIPTDLGQNDALEANWRHLFSLDYFQQNIEYLWEDSGTNLDLESSPVDESLLYSQRTDILLSDGSVLYSSFFRDNPPDFVAAETRMHISSFIFMDEFIEPDAARCSIFEKTVAYLQNRGVNVIFLLSPYHPLEYEYVFWQNELFAGFFMIEPWFTALAREYNIPLYGSYNPFVLGCDYSDFHDAWHIRREALAEIFPPMADILAAQSAGNAGSRWYLTGERMTPALAEAVLYEQFPGTACERTADDTIYGNPAFIFSLYSDDNPNTRSYLGRYAVTKEEGILFCYNTSVGGWVMNTTF